MRRDVGRITPPHILHHRDGVNVCDDLDGTPAGEVFPDGIQDGGEVEVRRGFEDDVDAVLSADSSDGTGNGSEDRDGGVPGSAAELESEFVGPLLNFGKHGAFEDDACETSEGGIAVGFAVHEFAGREAEVIVTTGELDGEIVGVGGLYDDLASFGGASGASGHLCEELEGALAGTEVGDDERGVGPDDTDEGDFGEIVSLGDHLGPDEDVHFALANVPDEVLVGARGAHGVGVHASDAGFGEEGADFVFDALGAESHGLEGT